MTTTDRAGDRAPAPAAGGKSGAPADATARDPAAAPVRPVALVIFDCDGVLVDSERLANEVFAAKLRELGLELSLEDMFERFVGHSMPRCLELVGEMLGRTPPDDFVADLQRRTFEAFARELRPVDGIDMVLDALDAARLPFCVASSGDHAKLGFTLGHTGLWPRFAGRVFSVVDVPRAKPAPDVYLLAARSLGVAPADCLVVEDTPIGVAAGVAAGMTVLGYARHMPSERLLRAGAHDTFSAMSALPERLGIA